MVGFFNYTVWLTYIALFSGSVGIFFSCSGNPLVGIICLSISGILDLFDGKVAKTKKNRTDDEKKYGIEIDSLTDLVCFGVLPCCIGYAFGMNHWVYCLVFGFFILCGMIRLAYYNVLEGHRQESGGKPGFLGVPITTSSMTAPLVFIICKIIPSGQQYVFAGYLVILGLLYILKIRLPKPNVKAAIILSIVLVIIYTVGVVWVCLK